MKVRKDEPGTASTENRTGGGMPIERFLEKYIANAIHIFLSLLSILILAAAVVAAWDTIVRDFPKFWQPVSEYSVLQGLIESVLLIAIAAELGLLLLFHRTTAAVEVIIFVIARKLISPEITVNGLLIGTLALISLVIVRFHYLPGKTK